VVDRSATVACPPSIVLAGIEQFFDLRANIFDLTVVLKKTRSQGAVTEYRVVVAYEPLPNRSEVGRHYDRLELNWRYSDATLPSFRGRLTIRPSGTKTTLALKGSYETPRPLEAEQAVRYDHIAQITGRVLLRELKAILESEFVTLQTQQPSA
jgi:hypothetical protein